MKEKELSFLRNLVSETPFNTIRSVINSEVIDFYLPLKCFLIKCFQLFQNMLTHTLYQTAKKNIVDSDWKLKYNSNNRFSCLRDIHNHILWSTNGTLPKRRTEHYWLQVSQFFFTYYIVKQFSNITKVILILTKPYYNEILLAVFHGNNFN